jgi:hypothetical protein
MFKCKKLLEDIEESTAEEILEYIGKLLNETTDKQHLVVRGNIIDKSGRYKHIVLKGIEDKDFIKRVKQTT